MNGCYKGLRAGEICGHHPKGCPITVMTPEQRADAFVSMNHRMLAAYSPGLFYRRLVDTIRAAEEASRVGALFTKS